MRARSVTVLVTLALAACAGDTIASPAPRADAASASITAPEARVEAAPAAPTHRDEDFVAADTNRDPFQSPSDLGPVPPPPPDIHSVMQSTAIDDMQLIAVVSGVADAAAMITGHDGIGHTVHRGDFVGRPELVTTGGSQSLSVPLFWRVDHISRSAVVLTRDDPTVQDRAPVTRVLALHDDGEPDDALEALRSRAG